MATKKKSMVKPQKWETEVREWLLLQSPEPEDGELQISPELKLVYATRSPYSVRALARQGKFGPDLGRAISGLIPEPGAPVADQTFRCLHGDGHWWAIYVIARGGIQKACCLAFQRNGMIGEAEKSEMYRCLSIGERLCRELLVQELESN
jgi:hypothetical protein